MVDFTVVRQGHCLNEYIQFGNLTRNASTYSWQFSDGQIVDNDQSNSSI